MSTLIMGMDLLLSDTYYRVSEISLSNEAQLDPHPEDRPRRPSERRQVHPVQSDLRTPQGDHRQPPGSTRDRNYAQTSWQGAAFELIDTGGLLLGTDDPLLGPAVAQADLAIEEADLVIFVVDGRAGCCPTTARSRRACARRASACWSR
jgi:hypothetical protein